MSKHVVISGAGSGLGLALARYYCQQGDEVCVTDMNVEAGEQAVETLNSTGGKAFFVACDITSDEQVEDLATTLKERWGKVDILINNAGVATAGTLEYEDIDQWQWVLNINLLGMVRMSRALVPLLRNSQQGCMINIASQAGITPIPTMASYNASKAAVVSFSETMHLELSVDNIHVCVACPSFFPTNLDKSLRSKQPGMDQVVSKLLQRSTVSADDVARYIAEHAAKGKFWLITHKEGRKVFNLKRWLPMGTYLNMVKKKVRGMVRKS